MIFLFFLFLFVIFFIYSIHQSRQPLPKFEGEHVTTVTSLKQWQEILESAAHHGYLVVCDFFAFWSSPCRKAAPIYGKISTEFPQDKILFFRVNIDDARDVAKECKVTCTPTYSIFFEKSEVAKIDGWNEKALRDTLVLLRHRLLYRTETNETEFNNNQGYVDEDNQQPIYEEDEVEQNEIDTNVGQTKEENEEQQALYSEENNNYSQEDTVEGQSASYRGTDNTEENYTQVDSEGNYVDREGNYVDQDNSENYTEGRNTEGSFTEVDHPEMNNAQSYGESQTGYSPLVEESIREDENTSNYREEDTQEGSKKIHKKHKKKNLQ